MKLIRKAGQTSQILQIFVRDRTSTIGAGLTGLVFNTASLTAYYHRDTDTTATAVSLVTMTVGTFTSSGFKEIDSTNMPGWYQFCPPNAAIAAGAGSVSFHLKGGGNMADLPIEMDLDAQVDVTTWNGTSVSSPSTAGIPEVNIKNINNVSAASVTTVNANLGQTQPVNFTGTGSSALIKSDTVDIAGAAVSTSTAQIGVNAVNLGGTAQTGRDIGASVLLSTGTGTGQLDFTSGVVKANLAQILGTALTETAGQIAAAFKQFFNIASPTGTVNLIPVVTTVTTTTTATNLTNAPTSGDFTATMKTSLNAATPASVTGAVGSVTGNVGGNVVGSVASVTARVTANTDQLAGQTVTAGAGVTFPASVASPTNITGGTITTVTNLTNAPTAGDFTATMKTSLNAATPTASLSTLDTLVLQSGTAQAGAASTITLASGASSTDNLYRGLEVTVYGGTGTGQSRVITGYVGSTKVATVDEAWITNPDNTSTYKVLEFRNSKMDSSQQVTAASVQGNVTGSVASVTGNVGGNVVGTVASVVGAVGSVTARVTANTDQLAGQTVTAGAGVTFPASVASPTNITAGTITTVTNVTNAPTAGDFTATMKTSLNSSSPGISATGVQAIWDALTSALTTTGSIGKLLVGMAASVWDVVLSGHTTGGTTGAALNAASSAGDPWATALPGAYSSGTAGNIVGNNLNATVSSRLPTASITLSAGAVTVGTNNDKTGYALTAGYDPAKTASQAGDAMALTSGERSTLAGVIWANAARTLTSFGTLVTDVVTAVWGATTRTLSAFGFTVATDVSSTVTTNLNATVSSRLATAGYTAPDNSDIVAIKAKTDNLPASPAAVSDIPTATQNADALLKRDMSAVTGEAARSPLNALRILRNKMSISGSTLTVTKEDDSTSAWTAAVGTTSGANPVTSVDPT